MNEENSEFDDRLNRLMGMAHRPKSESEQANLGALIVSLLPLCGEDASKWKSLVLALTYKRYHLKAPEAKISLKQALASDDEKKSNDKTTVGNGERSFFYVAITHLFQKLLNNNDDDDEKVNIDMVASALNCLIEIAPLGGGSRDICALIEAFVGAVLDNNDSFNEKRRICKEVFGQESLSLLVAAGVKGCTDEIHFEKARGIFDKLLRVAADTLDQDKDILESQTSSDGDRENQEAPLPSTLHVFVPHRDRGKPRKKKTGRNPKIVTIPKRQLLNSVAEVLIWSRTSLMSSNKAFAGSYERLLESASASVSDDSKLKAKGALHCMHTVIRFERKKFNNYARKEGFMLSNVFQLDRNGLKYRQIVRGKDGDINKLTKLATKAGSTGVLAMITSRFSSDLSKVTNFESVKSLTKAWTEVTTVELEEEVAHQLKQILHARLKATIRLLRDAFKQTEREIVLASLDSTVDSQVAALLMATAMGKWETESDGDAEMPEANTRVGCNLHLPSGDVHNVDSFQKVCDLLTAFVASDPEVFPTMTDSDGSATTKAVVNMVERHLKDNQTLLVVSSNELTLPPECLETLVRQSCSIHRHDVDELMERLKREGAKTGDITISLSWDTHDDLDLHVFLPSGVEVFYGKQSDVEGKAILDVDMNACGPYSNSPVENVFIGDSEKNEEAPHGVYRVVIQNFDYHTKGSTRKTEIPWQVLVRKNGKKERYTGKCVGTEEKSNAVACEFEYTGRTVPYEKKDQPFEATASSVNITTSVGQTLEALTEAIRAVGQQEQLNEVRQLLNEEESGEKKEDRKIVSAAYEVTSRDRNNVLLLHLPARFQTIVNNVFGGGDLSDQCAESIAKRMVQDKIPISEFKRAGYPDDIVESVREKMKVV